ncbi:MAG: RNA polymerase sigma factor [Candidatus Latescibacterota bacterium]
MEHTARQHLVAAAQAGDREAFGALVEEYRGMVFGLCLRLTASHPDAEDLAHDAFVEAFLKLGQLQSPQRFAGWLRTLTLNVCRMWLRRGRRAAASAAQDGEGQTAADDDQTASCLRIAAGLPDLDPEHRLVLVLHYWEGMSCRQVGEYLGVPVSTVLSRLHRARQALRRMVDDGTEDDAMPLDQAFDRTIDAEIGVLLRLFPDRPESGARLGQILAQDPGRLAHLLTQEDEETRQGLGLLLRRLGRPAIEAALECCFDGPEPVRARAVGLLCDLVAEGRPTDRTAGGEYGRHPPAAREGYLIADRLLAGPWERPTKVALLLDLLEACAHRERKGSGGEGPANLLTHVLLCYVDEAFAALLARFWQAADRREALERSWVLHALQHTGPRFGRALLEGLGQSDRRLLDLALAGLDVLLPWGRGWRWNVDNTPEGRRSDLESAPEARGRLALWLRFLGGYVPVLAGQLRADPGLPQELAAGLTELMAHPQAEVRHQAIRLGRTPNAS